MLGASVVVLVAAAFVVGFAGLLVRIRPGAWMVVVAIAVQVTFVVLAWGRLGTGAADRRSGGFRPRRLDSHRPHRRGDAAHERHVRRRAALPERDDPRDGRTAGTPLRDGRCSRATAPYQPDAAPKANAIVGRHGAAGHRQHRRDASRRRDPARRRRAARRSPRSPRPAPVRGWRSWAARCSPRTRSRSRSSGPRWWTVFVSSLLLATLALGLLWVWRHPPIVVLPALAGALALLVNTKFTGLVYVGLIVLPVLLVAGLLARLGRRLIWMLGRGRRGDARRDARPRVQPVRHQPAAPRASAAPGLRAGFARHRRAVPDRRPRGPRARPNGWSSPSSGRRPPGDVVEVKLPFTFTADEWSSFRSPSVRIGGFGPWFSGALLLAAVALVGALLTVAAARTGPQCRTRGPLLAIAGICLVATIIQPSSFLARFAPQLWFVAPLVAIAVALAGRFAVGARRSPGSCWACSWSTRPASPSRPRSGTSATPTARRHRWRGSAGSRRCTPTSRRGKRSEARRLREAGVQVRPVDFVPCKFPWVLSVAGGHHRPAAVPGAAAARRRRPDLPGHADARALRLSPGRPTTRNRYIVRPPWVR